MATVVPNANPDAPSDLDERTHARWYRRYADEVEQLRHAGIKTTESRMEHCVSGPAQWDRYIASLAPKLAHDMAQIGIALVKASDKKL